MRIKTKQKKTDAKATYKDRHIRKRLAQKRALEMCKHAKEVKDNAIRRDEVAESPQEQTIDNVSQRAEDAAYIAGRLIGQRGKHAIQEVAHSFTEKATKSEHDSWADNIGGRREVQNCNPPSQNGGDAPAENRNPSRQNEQGRNMVERRARDKPAFLNKASRHESPISYDGHSVTHVPDKPNKQGIKQNEHSIKTADLRMKRNSRSSKLEAKMVNPTGKINATEPMKEAAKASFARSRGNTSLSARAKAFTAKLKDLIESAKLLLNMALAGGWLIMVAVIAIAVIAFIVSSPLGVFFSGENGNGMTIPDAMQEFDAEFQARIQADVDELSAGGVYDSVEVIFEGDGDGDTTNNWSDVVTVYAVKYAYDSFDEVLTFDERRKEVLRDIFEKMNDYDIRSEIVTEEVEVPQPTREQSEAASAAEEGTGDEETETPAPITETKQHLRIFVTVNSKAYTESAAEFGFTNEQLELADEMMSPQYYELFAALFGIDLYDGTDVAGVINNLPAGTHGAAIVQAALTRLGDPYSQELRGQGRRVDCSYLAWWAYQQAGVSIPMTSVEQAKYCADSGYTIAQEALQPGDLVFWTKATCGCGRWQEIHHVGVYIGDGKVIEASYGKGRVVISKLYSGSKWRLHSFARPHI